MNVRWFIILSCGVLTVLSIIAALWKETPAPAEKTPLRWVTDANPARDAQIAGYTAQHPNVDLKIDANNTGIQKIVVQCSAGMGPDLIDHIYENNIQTLVDAGILLDLTDDASKNGYGLETLPENVRQLTMCSVLDDNGKLVKRQFVYPSNVYYRILLYNKTLFDKYNVPYPTKDMTWTEYEKLAKKMTIYNPGADMNRNLPIIFGGAGAELNHMVWGLGGKFFNEAGTVATVDSEAFFKGYKMYHNYIYSYNIEPSLMQKNSGNSVGGWGGGYLSWFGSGKVAMFWGARWNLIALRRFQADAKAARAQYLKKHPDAFDNEGPQVYEFGAVMVPRFANAPRYTIFEAKCTGINSQSEHLKESKDFITYLAGDTYSNLINSTADSHPGNKAYNKIELFINPKYPGEEEIHQASLDSIPYGHMVERSPFINNSSVARIMGKATDKLLSIETLSDKDIQETLNKAADEINKEISRNIARDSRLQKIYKALLEEGAEPIKYKDLK